MRVKKPSFVNMDDVDGQQSQVEKNVIKGAVLNEKKKSNAGRKKKSLEDKADEMMAVYFTAEQKEIVQTYTEKTSIPFSTLVKQLLTEKGIFN